MKVKIYKSFQDLPADYRIFFKENTPYDLFCGFPWLECLSRNTYNPEDELRIYSVESDDQNATPILMLPLCFKKPHKSTIFEPRMLSALSNYYTPLYSPLLNGSLENCPDALKKLVNTIVCERPRWDIIDLRPLEKDSFLFKELVQSFQREGMIVQTYFCFGNWFAPINGLSYQAYFENRPSQLKNTIRKRSKKIESTNKIRIEIISDAEKLPTALDDYEKVYRSSWQSYEPYPSFIRQLALRWAEKGILRLGIVYLDCEPIAVQLWVVNNGTAFFYKQGYDQCFSELSPGAILTTKLLRHAIDIDRVQEIDFLVGDDPYKRNWMTHRRERWGIMVFNPRTVCGVGAAIRHKGGHAAKNFVKKITTSIHHATSKSPILK